MAYNYYGGETDRMVNIVKRNIAPGESYVANGPTLLIGNVGKGASVNIGGGGLRVQGNVEDDTSLTVTRGAEHPHKGGTISYSGGGIQTKNVRVNGDFVINSTKIEPEKKGRDVSGILIEGVTGNNVTLHSDENIVLKSKAGNGLTVETQESMTAPEIGHGARLTVGTVANIGWLGENGYLKASLANLGWAGAGTAVTADNIINADAAHPTADLQARTVNLDQSTEKAPSPARTTHRKAASHRGNINTGSSSEGTTPARPTIGQWFRSLIK